MKNFWIFLLVVLVAAGAFFLGRRTGEPTVPATAAADVAPASATFPPPSDADAVKMKDHGDGGAPVRTFRGPDGRAHIISYDEKNPPDSNDAGQVRTALLSDMKYFPTNIQRSYGLSPADIQAMLAGSKSIPDYMLPVPGAPGAVK
jgi:hypothetical protein